MLYLDSSAFLKLIFDEVEAGALGEYLDGRAPFVSSVLLRLETMRAVGVRSPEHRMDADARLEGIELIPASDAIWHRAEMVRPAGVRSLDALHLATAASLGGGLTALVTYDRRMRAGAEQLGISAASPGA